MKRKNPLTDSRLSTSSGAVQWKLWSDLFMYLRSWLQQHFDRITAWQTHITDNNDEYYL